MKISVNDQELFTISDFQKKVIYNDIRESEFEKDMMRRLHYIIDHKYERCLERLKDEWAKDKRETVDMETIVTQSKLKQRGLSIPADDDEVANLIFSQPDYKSRETRYAEEMAEIARKQAEELAKQQVKSP